MTTPAPSQVRQNYHPDCEATTNIHINLEMYASYVYQSMAFYFDRDDVAQKHFVQYFRKLSAEKKGRAEKLMELQNLRGARIRLHEVQKPEHDSWHNSVKALECAMHLEKSINQNLLDLHQLATDMKDAHLRDFLERYFLNGQAKTIKELGDHLTNLRKMRATEDGMAEYLFNKLTLADNFKKH
ncbi:Ferritin heavy chain [Galemys pyrenaicus]|uniref:Ferritin n=1 Tax=Galemys pyrenaicus TaxID=202257 RepID=A0A8J5ZV86_GALPY|nr:Ferritin heavy chain [Galemys pyrenaicus]KAG8508075.1 Ferritin heavy chain [Galemys pyrenaicus]